MSSQRELLYGVIAWTAGMTLATFLVAIPGRAQSNSGDYLFFVGSGFLCQSNDSSSCPAVAKSADDSTYELSGAGTFNTRSKSVTATGTFTRKSPNGSSLETGIWMANELVSFDSYGVAPDALMRESWAFGPAEFGPRRMLMLFGSMPSGGLAVIRIRLLPMRGPARTAVLQVNCALGKVPDERQTEGIRLSFEGGGGEFDQEISGRTMFVLTGPGVSPTPKPPAPSGEANAAPAETER
jgi:hypothetical protein